jgi:hypothetical protein
MNQELVFQLTVIVALAVAAWEQTRLMASGHRSAFARSRSASKTEYLFKFQNYIKQQLTIIS